MTLATPREVVVYAAGSVRAAFTDIALAFEASEPGTTLRFVFGASGLLKDRLLAGERADVFASADMDHPRSLVAAGRGTSVQRFARNRLCVLAHPRAGVDAGNVLDKLLDPAIRVGTSTPRADPSADYTWEMFRRLQARGGRFADAQAVLVRKALQLTGGPTSPPPPAGRSVYAALVDAGEADVFITYCTNARQAQRESPTLQSIDLPEDVNVAAEYGVVALDVAGDRFVDALLGPRAQEVLVRRGFAPR